MRFVFPFIYVVASLIGIAGVARAQQCVNGQCSMVAANSKLSVRQTPSKTRISVQESIRSVSATSVPVQQSGTSGDGLGEVNAQRAKRGLRPYIRDDGLTAGAFNVARFRADRLMFGHTANDMRGLPSGVTAAAAGCAAYPAHYGFMACSVYDNYRYAGAAFVTGRDGKRYCQLFVR